jgi:hypothetical protein
VTGVRIPRSLKRQAGVTLTGRPHPAAQRVVEERRWLAVRRERRKSARESGEQRLAFRPRQQLSDAHVDAGAEADMPRRCAVDVVTVGFAPLTRIAVRGAEQHQHLLALGDCRASELDVSRRRAKERLHRRLEPDRLLEGGARLGRIGAQRRELIGIERKTAHRRADAMHRRIEAGAEQRPDQQFRLLPRHFTRVGRGVDHRPDAVVRKRLALALRRNPLDVRRHLGDCRPTQLVVGAEHVEHRRRIGQQVLAALLGQADRVRQHHHRVDLGAI